MFDLLREEKEEFGHYSGIALMTVMAQDKTVMSEEKEGEGDGEKREEEEEEEREKEKEREVLCTVEYIQTILCRLNFHHFNSAK